MKSNNRTNKYSFIFEGINDKTFVINLKDKIYRCSKMNICKKHNAKTFDGTPSLQKIYTLKDLKDCNCHPYYIIDKDKLTNQQISQIKKKIQSNGGTLILSSPCIELVFLALFNDFSNQEFNNYSNLEPKLNEWLTKKAVLSSNDKYKKLNSNSIKSINRYIENNKIYILKYWKQQLIKLNKSNKSNFIELVELFEQYKN